jgi:hypothetical protein
MIDYRWAEGHYDRLPALVEVDHEAVELLCESRLLDPRADFHSREDIGAAITQFLTLARRA